jgi:hypothetical protein
MSLIKNIPTSLTYLMILCTSSLLISCNGCKNETQHEIIAREKISIDIQRFDNELFAIKPSQIEDGVQKLYQKYGSFYLSYAHDILNMPEDKNDSLYTKPMKMLLEYKPLVELHQSVDSMFGEMNEIKTDLSNAMSIYKQEFPDQKIPVFITFISEFGYANITYDSMICIGLDMYMNKRYLAYYRAYEFPEFMIRKLQPEYIVPNTIKSMAIAKYENQSSKDNRFLATMITEGKVRYFTKSLIPSLHDSILMGYTAKQLEWSQQNEPQMWTHFIEKNLLFSNEPTRYMRYFNDGPFTSADGVPPESAPMIGTWAGLQIVRKYMKENPNITLQQLMDETDVDKILKLSKYRPK